jgi:hypothetical protein
VIAAPAAKQVIDPEGLAPVTVPSKANAKSLVFWKPRAKVVQNGPAHTKLFRAFCQNGYVAENHRLALRHRRKQGAPGKRNRMKPPPVQIGTVLW